ncbi:MAG: DNA internalization-related competence protein ComEC/Rec2 [Firmicutes bacterium]|nr:DNA internalization-related competence protein ComEC/Rec2 [Bacillota bacterium]
MAVLPAITIAFAAGILLAARIRVPETALIVFCLAALFTVICFFLLQKKPAVAVLLLLFGSLGMLSCRLSLLRLTKSLQPLAGKNAAFQGFICEVQPPEAEKTGFGFYIEEASVDGRTVSVHTVVQASLYASPEGFVPTYGLPLRLRGIVSLPSGPRNPGGFDYALYLAAKGSGGVLSITPGTVEVLPGRGGSSLAAFFAGLRNRALSLFAAYLPPAEAGLVSGMVLGQHAEMEEAAAQAYRLLGLAHLLSVSGLHVGYAAAWALFVFSRLAGRRLTALPDLFAGATVFCYALLVGGKPPVWRAALTFSLALWARRTGRGKTGLQLLAASALVLLVVQPLWLFQLSFQLSYAATAGVLLLSPRLEQLFARLPRIVAGPLAVTLAAQLALLPLQAAHFGSLSLFSVPLNLLCVPLAGVVIGLCLCALLAGLLWPPLAAPLCLAALPLVTVLDRVPRLLAGLAGAVFTLPTLPSLWWALYLAALCFLASGRKLAPLTGKKVLALLAACNILLFSALPLPGRGKLSLTFLDVGQGMAVHLATPAGRHVLIDAGSHTSKNVGENILLPYLRRRRVRQAEFVILTHPHADHYSGMPATLAALPVGAFIGNGQHEGTEAYARLLDLLAERNVLVYTVTAGWKLSLDGVQIRILSPPAAYLRGTGDDLNNNSLVLLVSYGNFSCLVTGDAEAAAMAGVELAWDGRQTVQVLQVPHHGSRSVLSASFLDSTAAQAAIISVGKNSFGHPHPETLELLAVKGLQVYRTDLHGAITVTSDGKGWSCSPYLAASYLPLVWL